MQRRGALARQINAVHTMNFPAVEKAIAVGIGVVGIGAEPLLDLVGQPVAVAVIDVVTNRRIGGELDMGQVGRHDERLERLVQPPILLFGDAVRGLSKSRLDR